jgi:DNA-binding GntR family transcriptional regulator
MALANTEHKPTTLNIPSLREQVYTYLRNSLHSGMLKPGSMINIDRFSRDLGVSKTPLKEAFIKLETEGFITIVPRKGITVNELTLAEIKNIYEIVGALEANALTLVFDQLTERHVKRMKLSNREQEQALEAGDQNRYYLLNIDFHNIFLDLSNNPMLQRLILPLKQRLYDFPRREYWRQWEQVNLEEHGKFIECIEKNDPEGAADVWKNEHWGWAKHKPYFNRFYNIEAHQHA